MAATDLITLAEARKQLRIAEGDTTRDAELVTDWIPAVTPLVEDVVGPVVTRTVTHTADGGEGSIALPSSAVSITSIALDGVALAASEYVADLAGGIVYAAGGGTLAALRQGIVVTYVAGDYATTDDVPKNIKLAARIILSSIWRVDQQGNRQAFGNPGEGNAVKTPSGFEIPKRAYALLEPDTSVDVLAGFA